MATKYFLLGLVLLLAPLLRPSTAPPAPVGYHADAWFRESDSAGVSTDLTISVESIAAATRVHLTLERTTPSCVGNPTRCPVDAVSADSFALVKAGDFVVAHDLTWAALHTRLSAYDSLTRSTLTFMIDLDWTATRRLPGVTENDPREVFDAFAAGVVATSSITYLANGRSWSGVIVRS